MPAGRVRVRRTDLDDVRELVLDGVPLAGGRLTVRTDGTGEVSGTRSRVDVESTNA